MKYIVIILAAAVYVGSAAAQSGAAVPASLAVADDGTILVAGSVKNAQGAMQVAVVGYNPDGSERGRKMKSVSPSAPLTAVACRTDGAAVIVLGTGGDAASPSDIVVYKFDVTSLVSTDEIPSLPQTAVLYPVYPNPVTGREIAVRFELPEVGQYMLSLHDLSGRLVRILEHETALSGVVSRSFPVGSLAAGTYIVVLRTGQSVKTQKILIRR